METNETNSSIYGKPNFPLIVGMFAVGIVVLLLCGWAFLHFDPLHMRGTKAHATGMTFVLPAQTLRL